MHTSMQCRALGAALCLLAFATLLFCCDAKRPILVENSHLKVSTNTTCGGTGDNCKCNFTSKAQVAVLKVQVYLPGRKVDPPYPVILFFHGFGGRIVLNSGDYRIYTDTATDAGYAVLQYDVMKAGKGIIDKLLSIIGLISVTDSIELQWLPQIVQWAETDPQLAGKLNFDLVATAGHSRGGKIAGLHYVLGTIPNIFTAFLIDPVGLQQLRPLLCSHVLPSAAPAARAQTQAAGPYWS
eukprot:jgi/Botrbrau1/16478/Bobra.0142s0072.1